MARFLKLKGLLQYPLIAKSKESDTVFMAKSVCDLPPFEAIFESTLPLF